MIQKSKKTRSKSRTYHSDDGNDSVEKSEKMEDTILPNRRFVNVRPPIRSFLEIQRFDCFRRRRRRRRRRGHHLRRVLHDLNAADSHLWRIRRKTIQICFCSIFLLKHTQWEIDSNHLFLFLLFFFVIFPK